MSDRFHRAAQDGYLEVLREATKSDCNARDEDGMTPTLWAAFEGNLDALRLLVGRGGDPEKSDNFGNTALHLASARGHMNCVTFMVNFGVNMWSQDIDHHTPQELAAMNDCNDILRYLDAMANKMKTEHPKKVKKFQEKAEKDNQKLVKNFKKVQEKADKQKEKLEKSRNRETDDMINASEGKKQGIQPQSFSSIVNNNSSKSSTPNTMSATPSFSSLTGTVRGGKKLMGTLFVKNKQTSRSSPSLTNDTFNVTTSASSDGKRTVRHLSGLRRDSEVMFMPPEERDEIEKLAALHQMTIKEEEDSGIGGGGPLGMTRRGTGAFGIFDRPGFGEMAFRRDSMAATLYAVQNDNSVGDTDEDDEDGHDSDDSVSGFGGAIDMFLAGLGLTKYIGEFRKQKIDLDTLMMLDEQNLLEMGIEIGPRKKILKAIDDRKKDLEQDDAIHDSQL